MKWQEREAGSFDALARLSQLPDHELLGVPPDAPDSAVRLAYRGLALTYHPDRASPFMRVHNEQVMKLINAAYARLMAGNEAED